MSKEIAAHFLSQWVGGHLMILGQEDDHYILSDNVCALRLHKHQLTPSLRKYIPELPAVGVCLHSFDYGTLKEGSTLPSLWETALCVRDEIEITEWLRIFTSTGDMGRLFQSPFGWLMLDQHYLDLIEPQRENQFQLQYRGEGPESMVAVWRGDEMVAIVMPITMPPKLQWPKGKLG